MTGGSSSTQESGKSLEAEKQRVWELFARTGFPCALRALRELERREERSVALSEVPAA